MTQAYPLSWPDGWPRHKGERDSDLRFKGDRFYWDTVMRQLREEVGRIGGTDIIISTMQPLREDGLPRVARNVSPDPGVAVYFTRQKKSLVMAQDRFATIIGNARSLTMSIEGLRQMERHGGAQMMERAFTGFAAISPPDWKKPWREVFGLKPGSTIKPADLKMLFRNKAKLRHPDMNGGDPQPMAELNVAYAEAQAEIE